MVLPHGLATKQKFNYKLSSVTLLNLSTERYCITFLMQASYEIESESMVKVRGQS